jgi:hypothetical protein
VHVCPLLLNRLLSLQQLPVRKHVPPCMHLQQLQCTLHAPDAVVCVVVVAVVAVVGVAVVGGVGVGVGVVVGVVVVLHDSLYCVKSVTGTDHLPPLYPGFLLGGGLMLLVSMIVFTAAAMCLAIRADLDSGFPLLAAHCSLSTGRTRFCFVV